MVSTYYDRPQHMRMLREAAMKEDFSWERSILEYEYLFALLEEGKAQKQDHGE